MIDFAIRQRKIRQWGREESVSYISLVTADCQARERNKGVRIGRKISLVTGFRRNRHSCKTAFHQTLAMFSPLSGCLVIHADSLRPFLPSPSPWTVSYLEKEKEKGKERVEKERKARREGGACIYERWRSSGLRPFCFVTETSLPCGRFRSSKPNKFRSIADRQWRVLGIGSHGDRPQQYVQCTTTSWKFPRRRTPFLPSTLAFAFFLAFFPSFLPSSLPLLSRPSLFLGAPSFVIPPS